MKDTTLSSIQPVVLLIVACLATEIYKVVKGKATPKQLKATQSKYSVSCPIEICKVHTGGFNI